MSIRFFLFLGIVAFFPEYAWAQSLADFSADETSGCPPFTLKLNDNSTNPNGITSWEWTLNNVFLSSQQDPATLLSTPGFYSICLTVTSSSGSDTECKNNFIEVFEPPTAQSSAVPQSGCIPLDVVFTDNSTPGSGNITGVTWDFGGSCGVVTGVPGGAVNCNYTNAGSFQVSMIITDENGCQDNIVNSDFIQTFAPPPITAFVPNYNNCEPPFTVDFGNAGPNNPDVNYSWNFGNGQTFNGLNPGPINYPGQGPYTISITANNSVTGCSNAVTLNEVIEEANPLNFSFARMSDCGIPEVAFLDESIGSADMISWDFGDGNTSTQVNPVHTFTNFGCFTVVMTRTVGNCTKSTQEQICVFELTPTGVITNITDDISCSIPFTTSFSVQQNPGTTYAWDFGDGGTATGINPSHTYTGFDDYSVELTVTDELGCQVIVPVGIVEVAPIGVRLGSAGSQGCAPLTVNFDPDVSSSSNISTYNWEILDDSNVSIFQSTQANPSFTFLNIGCYTVTLQIENIEGCQRFRTYPDVYCVGDQPIANFTFDPSIGCASDVFSFTDQSSGTVNSWQWDFESDGTIDDVIPDPTFMFTNIGCFNPTLTVANNGCSSSQTLGPVCISPPLARFNIQQDCDIPTLVNFNSTSIQADSVIWDFGVLTDLNDTSSLDSTQFQYAQLGIYDVTLITYNFSSGCVDTARLELELTVPTANFSIPGTSFCRNEIIPITNNSIGSSMDNNWSLPDGGMINNPNSSSARAIFSESGTYSITLEILDVNQCPSSFTIDNIQVSGPEVEFDFDVSNNCVPFDANFTSISSNLLANNTIWEWNIAELNLSSALENPTFELDTVGIFTINLAIEDENGCRDSIMRSVSLNEGAPVAFFTGELFGCEGFDNSFEDLSVGNTLTYSWDYGDGTMSNDQNTTHEFPLGDFQVSLTVGDGNCSDTHTELVQIQEIIANFAVDSSYSSCAPSPVNFFNQSQNGANFFWNYGDGTGVIEIEDASHIYNLQGIYGVSLLVVGENENCVDSIQIPELIQLNGPQATFEYAINDFCIPSEMEISIQGERPYDYIIFLGDGNSIEIDSNAFLDTSYVFTTPTDLGFLPTLLVEEFGCPPLPIEGEDTIRLSELLINFEGDHMQLCTDDRSVQFESEIISSDPNYSVNWEFSSGLPNIEIEENPLVIFPTPGNYDVKLIVENNNCIDSIFLPGHIEVYEVGSLAIEDQEACFGDTITITAALNTNYISWSTTEEIIAEDSISISLIAEGNSTVVATGAVGPCPEVSDEANIVTNPLPELIMENFFIYFPGNTITIGPEADLNLNYFWDPIDILNCNFCPNPSVMDTSGDFRLTVTDPLTGCFAQDVVMVREYNQCPEFSIFLPNAFSPNGDGQNDEFMAIGALLNEIEFLRVYDRWGNFIWETTSIDEGWDGTYNGKKVNPGVYAYVLQSICSIDGRPFVKYGDVTVLR